MSAPRAPAASLDGLPTGFYRRQALWLGATALLLLAVFRLTPLDVWLLAPWYDPASRGFPLRENWWLAEFNHHWVKDALLVLAPGLFAAALLPRLRARRRLLLFLAAALVLVPSAVGLAKHNSDRACPWDLARYGGKLAEPTVDGRCFPAGHASGGLGCMAFYFALRRRSAALGVAAGAAGFLLGQAMGWGQMMRGAHFLSHNLWSAWLGWLVILLTHAAFFWRPGAVQR